LLAVVAECKFPTSARSSGKFLNKAHLRFNQKEYTVKLSVTLNNLKSIKDKK